MKCKFCELEQKILAGSEIPIFSNPFVLKEECGNPCHLFMVRQSFLKVLEKTDVSEHTDSQVLSGCHPTYRSVISHDPYY